MKNAENPNYEGNSSKYHTGKECIETDCHNPAGTVWSEFWCQSCNAKRLNRISSQFDSLLQDES